MVKKIHYIWLGEKKKPHVIKECIKSWKKHMPDWDIVEWNEDNVDLDICPFCRQAYDTKKYAFAADVLRFDILSREGGLYFDTDVRVLKSFELLISEYPAFTGYEFNGAINPGLVLYAATPNNEVIDAVLESYRKAAFINGDGTLNLRVVGEYFADALKGYIPHTDNQVHAFGSFTVFPSTYFCPIDGLHSIQNYSDNTSMSLS